VALCGTVTNDSCRIEKDPVYVAQCGTVTNDSCRIEQGPCICGTVRYCDKR
jgi:hypothetical protein